MNVVTTNRANCKDCYKCVRSCPMKAIKIVDGHAKVVDELCIQDGMCVRVCPQGAKEVRSDLELAKNLVASKTPVLASLAPSFIATFDGVEPGKVVAAIRRLGFDKVQETAIGAEIVALAQRKISTRDPKPILGSSCPAIVNLIKRYFPQAIPNLSPVVSPMVAHSRMARKYWGEDLDVVFIGPCVAKKDEMSWDTTANDINAVLTFDKLIEWLNEEEIDISSLEPESFDTFEEHGGLRQSTARLFPLEGGALKTAECSTDFLEKNILIISGMEPSLEFLEEFIGKGDCGLDAVEIMACSGGCINGAGFQWKNGLTERRMKVLDYAQSRGDIIVPDFFISEIERQINDPKSHDNWIFQEYKDEHIYFPQPDESEIRKVLSATGKFTKEDELNCGACGYNSCREKAIAVCRGMAEVEMCIPYMRARAESLSTLVLEHIPNGIVVTDRALNILDINPSAEQMFKWNIDKVKGRYLPDLIEGKLFLQAIQYGKPVSGKTLYYSGSLIVTELVVPVFKEGLIIGIFTDITREERQREELARVRMETLEKTQQVIDKQMRVAQEIAGLLGETTAETKVLLTKLMNLIKAEEE